MPDYEPPTIDDLARVEKGGGGNTIDKRYRKRPTYTPPPPRPWAEVREIVLQRAEARERGKESNPMRGAIVTRWIIAFMAGAVTAEIVWDIAIGQRLILWLVVPSALVLWTLTLFVWPPLMRRMREVEAMKHR